MKIKYTIIEDVQKHISTAVDSNYGQEVFFGAVFGNENQLISVEPICFGTEDQVFSPPELARKFNAVLHNHPGGDLRPSDQDMTMANYLKNEGIGFFIVNNSGTDLKMVYPPVIIKKSSAIKTDIIAEIFDEGGLISKYHDNYEFRHGQKEMALRTIEALNNGYVSVIEAGTGIGKSLAYLIPAFVRATENNERVVISTNTINLQNQLIGKDIPFVKKILKSDIEPVLIKGRRNYLCKLKLNNAKIEFDFGDKNEQWNNIVKWSETTPSGDIDELNFIPDNEQWERVASESDFCTGANCSYYQSCFLQQQRRRAAESNILIVNHHILFADINLRYKGGGLEENILLPPYKKIIIDEAHNIDRSASGYFSISFSKHGFYKFLSLLRPKGGKGFFPRFTRKLTLQKDVSAQETSEFIDEKVISSINEAYDNSYELFDIINIYIGSIIDDAENNYKSGSLNIQKRILEQEWQSERFNNHIKMPLKNLGDLIMRVYINMSLLYEKCKKFPDKIKETFDVEIKTLKSYCNKVEGFAKSINDIINSVIDKSVCWFELFGDRDNLLFRLNISPLFVNNILNEALFSAFESVVLASATMTVDNQFEFIKFITGLNFVDQNRLKFYSYPSPFDYEKMVLLCTPSDGVDPANNAFGDYINRFVAESIRRTGGASFVLFTSYSQLNQTYKAVSPLVEPEGYQCYYQGQLEKSRLLNAFISDHSSSLFATDSFWEGVDAPGETLCHVILSKLPFKMPSEPLEQARVEELNRIGKNGFNDYTLPQAVLKFRQGFGRLIRKKTDYGIVTILDPRVITKNYGKTFIRSLPRCSFFYGNKDEMLDKISDYIKSHKK